MAMKPKKTRGPDDRPSKKKTKSQLPTILALAGGGLFLLTCCGGGGGAFWYFTKSAPIKTEEGPKEQAKDKGNDPAGTAPGSKLKRAYEQVKIDNNAAEVEKLMGRRGTTGFENIPAPPGSGPLGNTIDQRMKEHKITLVWSYIDLPAKEGLVVGLVRGPDEKTFTVGFKGYYYYAGGETRADYEFTKKK